MIILGIETSCDETSVAIVDSDRNILSNLVLSQIDEHQAFGGVVPEIAARSHIDHIHTLITAALNDANTSLDNIDAIAATCGPGLIGGVLVGSMTGKAIAMARGLPFIAVNHLEGHALTPRLTNNIAFPYLLLLISGGHTQILVCEGVDNYKLWGTTLDDAAGECFDKSAKIMGLPYPGGPHLEKMALTCKNPELAIDRFPLPRPMKGRKELDFSFSGLKTAILNHVNALPPGDLDPSDIADLAYAFHIAVADIFEDRITRAAQRFEQDYGHAPTIVLSGGVSANQFIGDRLKSCFKEKPSPRLRAAESSGRLAEASHTLKVYNPPLSLCGDNAAMIAWAGLERLQNGLTDDISFKSRPRWPLDNTK